MKLLNGTVETLYNVYSLDRRFTCIDQYLYIEFSRRKQSVISALPLGNKLRREEEKEKERGRRFPILIYL